MSAIMFGELFKGLRLKKGNTLREYCRNFEQDPSYISKLERGIIAPPINEYKLRILATSVGLKKDTDEWRDFMNIAKISAGRIPDKIMADENVLARLPLLFSSIDGRKLDDAQLSNLIELIKIS